MAQFTRQAPDFSIQHESAPSETLLCGFANFGLAGLTAVDYLVDHLELEERGHLTAEGLPSITPFVEGTPNHHTRLFSRDDLELTVLKSELFVPAVVSKPFSDAILDWTESHDVREIAVLTGIPLEHGPEDHKTFYIATEDYQQRRLTESDVAPMGRGFLDGVNGALVERGIDSPLGVGVFVTPVHAQVPDVEAALRLIDTVDSVYDLEVDTGPLQAFADEVARYYEELADRMQSAEKQAEMPEDRMYM